MAKSIIQEMIKAKIISEKDIAEYYNANLKGKYDQKPVYSIIKDGVLVKFDERDLDEHGNYTTPKGVYKIGDDAFRDSDLRGVCLGEDVVEIGNAAFIDCYKLCNATMTNSVTKMGAYAFQSCRSLFYLNLSDNITEIPAWAFYDCINLESILLPSKLEKIDFKAFWRCDNLTSISTPPESLVSVDVDAFNRAVPVGNDFMRKFKENQELQRKYKVK